MRKTSKFRNYAFITLLAIQANLLFSQNVGIGTTNPDEKLTVHGTIKSVLNSSSSSPHIKLYETQFDYSRLSFENNSTPFYWSIAGRPAVDSTDSKLNFYYSDLGNVMALTGAGRVGVNVNTPAATFHANAKPGNDLIRIQNNNSTKFRIFENNAITFGSNWNDPIPNVVKFNTPNLMVGFTSSYVPQEKLEVDGTIMASGLKLPTGAGNGYFLKSDVDGNAYWDQVVINTADKWENYANNTVTPSQGKDVCIDCNGVTNRARLAIGEGGLSDEAVKIKTSRTYALKISSDHDYAGNNAQGAVQISQTGSGMSAVQIEGQDIMAPSLRCNNVGFGPAAVFQSFWGTTAINASADVDNAIAAKFTASNGVNGIGARGLAFIGVEGYSTNVVGSMGVRGLGRYSGSGTYYGGYFEANWVGDDGIGLYARGSSRGVEANGGDFDFYASGFGVNYGSGSSRRWKTNIRNIDNPIKKLQQLRGVYYTWDEEHGGMHDIGFIAEEIAEILPEIVVYSKDGKNVDGLDYSKMTPLLLEALNTHIAEYEIKTKHLEQLIKKQSEIVKRLEAIEAKLENN